MQEVTLNLLVLLAGKNVAPKMPFPLDLQLVGALLCVCTLAPSPQGGEGWLLGTASPQS